MTGALAVTVRNQRSELARISRLIEAFGEAHALSPELVFKVNLALDEIITNIVLHGYDDRDSHDIRIALDLRGESLTVTVEDDGRAFDPLSVAPPDLDLDAGTRDVGGLGLHIVRSIMDGVEYRRDGGLNRLVMRASTVGH
jgi:anti-sigma regulatory factor (Ser/Thr protein kinase)